MCCDTQLTWQRCTMHLKQCSQSHRHQSRALTRATCIALQDNQLIRAGQWWAPHNAGGAARQSAAPGHQQLLPELPGACRGDVERAPALPQRLRSVRCGGVRRKLCLQPSSVCGSFRSAAYRGPGCHIAMDNSEPGYAQAALCL